MSCEVKPKWTNSREDDKPKAFILSLIKYSTALTSWLVVFSISLTAKASDSEKFVYRLLNSGYSSLLTSESCGRGISQSEMKYSTSIFTLYLIKAASEKYCAKSFVTLLYLPSIGEIAVKVFNSMCKICLQIYNI